MRGASVLGDPDATAHLSHVPGASLEAVEVFETNIEEGARRNAAWPNVVWILTRQQIVASAQDDADDATLQISH